MPENLTPAHRILILEDDPAVASVYATILRKSQFEVSVCGTLAAAKAQVATFTPDALLADVRVGEFNGLQVAILFRSISPDAPIVVVSGHDDPVIRQEAGRINAEFLLKPVPLDTLRRHFESVVSRPS